MFFVQISWKNKEIFIYMTKYTLPSLSSKFHYDVLISYRRKRSKLHHCNALYVVALCLNQWKYLKILKKSLRMGFLFTLYISIHTICVKRKHEMKWNFLLFVNRPILFEKWLTILISHFYLLHGMRKMKESACVEWRKKRRREDSDLNGIGLYWSRISD